MARSLTDDFLNIEKLKDIENYQTWKFQLGILLRANELYETITEETSVENRNAAWKKKDAMAQKYIVTSLDKKPLMHIMNCTTAYEMWLKISNIYERESEQQKCDLLQMFYSTAYDKDLDIASYISKLRNVAYRLNALDTKIDETMLIAKILPTLPEELKHFVSAWDSTEKSKKTVENLTSRLIAEESRSSSKDVENNAVAFKTTQRKCTKCNKVGHFAKFCKSKTSSQDKKPVKCFKCNKSGHIARACPENRQNAQDACGICKKNNHKEKDCFYRNKKEGKKEDTEKIAFL